MTLAYDQGTYLAGVVDVALGESSGGHPQIVARCKILEQVDPSTGQSQVVVQYERTIYMVVVEASQEYVLKKLRHAGWNGIAFEDIASLSGMTVRLVCVHELATQGKYKGSKVEKWDFELPIRQGQPLEHNPNVAKKLNALFGKTLKEGVSPAQAVAANPATPDRGGEFDNRF